MIKSQEEAIRAGLAPSAAALAEMAEGMAPYQAEMLESLRRLCAVPSVRAEAEADAPYGRATVEALNTFLELGRSLGFRAENVDNEAGYLEIGSGETMIAAVCHLDVVPAGTGWTADPFTLREIDDRLIARGTADDKGPLVAVLYGLKALLDEGYEAPCRIRVIVGLNEENGSSCMRHYCRYEEHPCAGFTADASFPAIYAEKGHIKLYLRGPRPEHSPLLTARGGSAFNMVPGQCKLQLQVGEKTEELVFEGKPAHASMPENGRNAIQLALADLSGRGVADPLVDFFRDCLKMETDGKSLGLACRDESGALTLNVGLLEIDAREARLGLDIRYPIHSDGQALLEKLAAKAGLYGLAVDDPDDSVPLDLGQHSPMVTSLMAVYNTLCGTKAEAVAIGGGTYARAVPNILAFGMMFPGDPDCMHQIDEFVEKERFFAAAAIYREAFRALAELQR